MQKRSPDTITMTKKDLMALASKIANHEKSEISKPAALNMIAATILGPNHDWSWIKNSDDAVVSQRAQSLKPAEPKSIQDIFPIPLVDEETDLTTFAKIDYRQDTSIEITTDDGQVVWVERNSDTLQVHVYNRLSDGAAHIFSGPTSLISADNEDFLSEMLVSTPQPLPKDSDKAIIGYQVDNPYSGENWGDRTSYQILKYEDAVQDLIAAHAAGETDYVLLPVRAGDVEEPEFI